jgi:hypothetical protein
MAFKMNPHWKDGRSGGGSAAVEHEKSESREFEAGEHEGAHEGAGHPHIFVHSHSKGHTVHIHHQDGRHEKHEHAKGDAEGIAAHIHEHYGGGGGEHAMGAAAGGGGGGSEERL